MGRWLSDLRSALRALRRNPGFAAVSALSAALGIGMATLAFGVAYTLLWLPYPFPHQERLVTVSMERSEELAVPSRVSAPELADFGAAIHGFSAWAGYRSQNVEITLQTRHGPVSVPSLEVTSGFFQVFGLAPRLGRVLRPGDERPGAPRVMVIGDRVWRQRFGADPAIVGQTVVADEAPATVVGVMPPGFGFPTTQQVWMPFAATPGAGSLRQIRDLRMIARLRPGVSTEQAEEEVRRTGSHLASLYPASTAGWSGHLRPLRSFLLNPETRLALHYLGVAAGFIVLIAGANLLHLLLVRLSARRHELAVRAAFGAGPVRLARQAFLESALLATAGGVLGTGFAAFFLRRVAELVTSGGAPPWIRFTIEPPVAFFALAATVAFALLFGLPAVLREALRRDLSPVLKESVRTGETRRMRRLRAVLLVSEVAASVLLLTGASLTLRSLLALRAEPGGVHTAGLITLWTRLPAARYADGPARARWIADVLARLRDIPGVRAGAASDDLLHYFRFRNGLLTPVGADGRPGPDLRVPVHAVSPGYFDVLGTPLLAGRDLKDSAAASPGENEALVSESLARALWPHGKAVGQRVLLRQGGAPVPFIVVGVAADIRHGLLSAAAAPALYVPLAAGEPGQIGFLFATSLDPERLFPEAARRIQAADPRLPVFDVMTLGELRDFILFNDRERTSMALLCAAVALVLALLGIYSVLSYTVSRQVRAIGVRLALGATRWQVMRQIIGRGLALTLAGTAIGLVCSLSLGHVLARFLYQVRPADPVSYLGIAILVFDTAFIACYLPARKVLEVEPADVLRQS